MSKFETGLLKAQEGDGTVLRCSVVVLFGGDGDQLFGGLGDIIRTLDDLLCDQLDVGG